MIGGGRELPNAIGGFWKMSSPEEVKKIKTIEDLTPDPDNANLGTEYGNVVLEDSLRQYGAGRSILVDRDGEVIAGNKTLQVAAEIDLPVRVVQTNGRELVVVQRTDLDLTEGGKARELAYADNRVGEINLNWNLDQVMADLDTGVDLSGLFSTDDLDEMLAALDIGELPDDVEPQIDRAAELQEVWQTAVGQVWELGDLHRLAVGDCTDKAVVEAVMRGERADAVVTDPPYGKNASGMTMGSAQSSLPKEDRLSYGRVWDNERPEILWVLAFAERVCIWGGNYFADVLPPTNDWLCWHKKNDGLSFSEFELAWTNYGRQCRHISHHWGAERKEHITQKPLKVIEWAITQCPGEGRIVLDPFVGSGTTIVACERLGRKARAIEIDPGYAAVAIQRWADLTKKEPRLLE